MRNKCMGTCSQRYCPTTHSEPDRVANALPPLTSPPFSVGALGIFGLASVSWRLDMGGIGLLREGGDLFYPFHLSTYGFPSCV